MIPLIFPAGILKGSQLPPSLGHPPSLPQEPYKKSILGSQDLPPPTLEAGTSKELSAATSLLRLTCDAVIELGTSFVDGGKQGKDPKRECHSLGCPPS